MANADPLLHTTRVARVWLIEEVLARAVDAFLVDHVRSVVHPLPLDRNADDEKDCSRSRPVFMVMVHGFCTVQYQL